jgi:2-polyprenyl-3-methyl-5-hydroxy-6-metoxy-1,4-benzoquinol methylase
MPDRTRARQLAREFNDKNDPTGWFEQLYREADQGTTQVPWADLRPNINLLNYAAAHPLTGTSKRALTIGCGFGDDAEQLAAWGFDTTAFDISETAVRRARKRFPESRVNYVVADVLQPPRAEWRAAFDFILEVYTLQVLPDAELRSRAIANIAAMLRPHGEILVIARGREPYDSPGEMPWPLTKEDLRAFTAAGLTEISFEDFPDPQSPETRRFRVLYRREV